MSQQETVQSNGSGLGKGHALLVVAGLGLAGLGLAAGLMIRSPSAAPELMAEQPNTAPSSTTSKSNNNNNNNNTTTNTNTNTATARPVAKVNTPPAPRAAERAPLDTQTAALCNHCGTVEAVRPVQRKGEGSGVGAVAGGVVGAVVGNQMGGGNGKAAMTVLGALGGGMAGNEVEKRTKSTTVYEVQVRMDDGTLRTFTSASSPTPGASVTVDGQGFRVVQGPSSTGGRVIRTMS